MDSNLKIFTVYDSKAECYINPFFLPNRGVALRAFTEAARDTQHDFHRWAADYTLFEIGEWDPGSGTILMHEARVSLGCAIDFRGEGGSVTPLMEMARERRKVNDEPA